MVCHGGNGPMCFIHMTYDRQDFIQLSFVYIEFIRPLERISLDMKEGQVNRGHGNEKGRIEQDRVGSIDVIADSPRVLV